MDIQSAVPKLRQRNANCADSDPFHKYLSFGPLSFISFILGSAYRPSNRYAGTPIYFQAKNSTRSTQVPVMAVYEIGVGNCFEPLNSNDRLYRTRTPYISVRKVTHIIQGVGANTNGSAYRGAHLFFRACASGSKPVT